jgi:hypothetical protein
MVKLSAEKKEQLIKEFGHIPTKEEIFEKIRTSQERLVVSLIAAWESAPNDPEIKSQILEAMQKASEIREKVYKKILKEEPPDIKESYEKLRKIIEQEAKSKD